MFKQKPLQKAALLATASIPLLMGSISSAHAHGESIRGGGSGSVNAMGAAILEEPVIGLRWDARRYETFSNQQLVNFKKQDEDVHMHSSEDAYFLSFGFPVNEDMDISLMLQYNNFKGFKDNGDGQASDCFDGTFTLTATPAVKGSPSSAKCISS
ncbi:MAG: hypothetical protein GXP10_09655, partial [Gammaproteobacteria bacterium]|nr:hypothetical protein [Gammaproteobacteria bacterium]